jgi:hypothetical protein
MEEGKNSLVLYDRDKVIIGSKLRAGEQQPNEFVLRKLIAQFTRKKTNIDVSHSLFIRAKKLRVHQCRDGNGTYYPHTRR